VKYDDIGWLLRQSGCGRGEPADLTQGFQMA
jgi:hypothetical protein